MREKLKPCPFCGGEAKAYEDMQGTHCVQCKCCGMTTLHGYKYEAAKTWNRRIESVDSAIYERISYLENLVAESFLNTEGELICLADEGDCELCEIKDLCEEAESIIEKEMEKNGKR